jgi:hypothetical protein
MVFTKDTSLIADDKHKNQFIIHSTQPKPRDYHIQAFNPQEAKEWLDAIRDALVAWKTADNNQRASVRGSSGPRKVFGNTLAHIMGEQRAHGISDPLPRFVLAILSYLDTDSTC